MTQYNGRGRIPFMSLGAAIAATIIRNPEVVTSARSQGKSYGLPARMPFRKHKKSYPPTPELLAKREAKALKRQRNYERCIKNNNALWCMSSNNWLIRPRFIGFDPAKPGSDTTVYNPNFPAAKHIPI